MEFIANLARALRLLWSRWSRQGRWSRWSIFYSKHYREPQAHDLPPVEGQEEVRQEEVVYEAAALPTVRCCKSDFIHLNKSNFHDRVT
jgi:hypothetical protein